MLVALDARDVQVVGASSHSGRSRRRHIQIGGLCADQRQFGGGGRRTGGRVTLMRWMAGRSAMVAGALRFLFPFVVRRFLRVVELGFPLGGHRQGSAAAARHLLQGGHVVVVDQRELRNGVIAIGDAVVAIAATSDGSTAKALCGTSRGAGRSQVRRRGRQSAGAGSAIGGGGAAIAGEAVRCGGGRLLLASGRRIGSAALVVVGLGLGVLQLMAGWQAMMMMVLVVDHVMVTAGGLVEGEGRRSTAAAGSTAGHRIGALVTCGARLGVGQLVDRGWRSGENAQASVCGFVLCCGRGGSGGGAGKKRVDGGGGQGIRKRKRERERG